MYVCKYEKKPFDDCARHPATAPVAPAPAAPAAPPAAPAENHVMHLGTPAAPSTEAEPVDNIPFGNPLAAGRRGRSPRRTVHGPCRPPRSTTRTETGSR